MKKVFLIFTFLSITMLSSIVYADTVSVDSNVPSNTPQPTLSSGYSSPPQLEINNFTSNLGSNLIILKFNTNREAKCTSSWTNQSSLAYQSFAESNALSSHNLILNNLAPGTKYSLSINCLDNYNLNANLNQEVSTLDLLQEVTNLQATANENSINLHWVNPIQSIFAGVRIIRSSITFPKNSNEQTMVFEGVDNHFLDSALESNTTYYYTVFTYDKNGAFSKGMMIQSQTLLKQIINQNKTPTLQEQIINNINNLSQNQNQLQAGNGTSQNQTNSNQNQNQIVPLPNAPGAEENEENSKSLLEKNAEQEALDKFNLLIFNFLQDEKPVPIINVVPPIIPVIVNKPLKIVINKKDIPPDTDRIIATVFYFNANYVRGNSNLSALANDITAKAFVFDCAKEDTDCYTSIEPPPVAGVYPLVIDMFDKDNKLLKHLSGQLQAESKKTTTYSWWWWFSAAITLIVVYEIIRRIKRFQRLDKQGIDKAKKNTYIKPKPNNKKSVTMLFKRLLFVIFFILLPISGIKADMNSANYSIKKDSINIGGTENSTSTNYGINDSMGEVGTGTSNSANYQMQAGYRPELNLPTLSFSLSTNSASLGTLSSSSASTASVTATVTTNARNGYNISVQADGNLRTSGGKIITDVADGAVTAGSREYGIGTSGVDGLYNASDASVTTTPKNIAGNVSVVTNHATVINFKASIDSSTAAGAYSQKVTVIATGNF